MSHITKEFIESLVKNNGDLDEVIRRLLGDAINDLLQAELTSFLGYEPYNREGFNSGNSRNGSYSRTFKTKHGELNLDIPRDRNGQFQNQTLPAYGRRSDYLEETVIQLYSKGITTSEIADLIDKMYGHYYTPQTISNITKTVTENIEAFHQREHSSEYAVVYLDATYFPLRRGNMVSKEAICVAIGIKTDGTKEVIDYKIAPQESIVVWEELLLTMKEYGLNNVLLFVTDGLKGLDDLLHRLFPNAQQQRCLVHVSRNIYGQVRQKDRADVMNDFKKIHQQNTMAEVENCLLGFKEKWQSIYPNVIKKIDQNPYLLTFMNFPTSIRSSIYSINLIESNNRMIKCSLCKKEQFPNIEALERFLTLKYSEYNTKFESRCHKGFKQCKDTLESMF